MVVVNWTLHTGIHAWMWWDYTCKEFLLKSLCQSVYCSRVTLYKCHAKDNKSINKLHSSNYEKYVNIVNTDHLCCTHLYTSYKQSYGTTRGHIIKITSEAEFLARKSQSLLPKEKRWCFSIRDSSLWLFLMHSSICFCPPEILTSEIVLILRGQSHPSE